MPSTSSIFNSYWRGEAIFTALGIVGFLALWAWVVALPTIGLLWLLGGLR